MESKIKNYILDVDLSKLQSHKNMGVIPLTTPQSGGPEYVTLKQVLERNYFTIR